MTTKTVIVKCPSCGSEKVSKNGRNKTGKQVYNCRMANAHAKILWKDINTKDVTPAFAIKF